MLRTIFNDEHRMFRDSVRRFVEKEIKPYHEQWEKDGLVPRDLWRKAGAQGYLCMDVPEDYGGGGIDDFRYNLILVEELTYANTTGPGFSLHNDVAIPYLLRYGTDEQKRRWLPKCATGENILAIAMTEPGGGSDLANIQTRAIRDGDCYILNGSKTFITNGINNDLVIVACKTDPTKHHDGLSLIVVERGMEGYTRGRNLEKVGWHAQDTAELFFQDVRVPLENLLGGEGQGFYYLVQNLPQERLVIAAGALAAAEAALDWTIAYCKEREAFGRPIGTFQNSRFKLAEMKTEITIGRVYLDRCVMEHLDGNLSGVEAAQAKWWATDLQNRVVDQCLQLFGGYGYMLEYPIAKAYLDMRWGPIGGGTNEIMKDLIGRAMGF
ncbi:MAG: acyl-CoA dehydrogenase family protein [bacterium]|nr:acyl-CoA dehydrogenase family protein [bacterium]